MDVFKELETQTVKDIENLQDFQAFTASGYDGFIKAVKNSTISGTVVNTLTNTALDVTVLATALEGYLDNELSKVVLYQLVSIFDIFWNKYFFLLEIEKDKGRIDVKKDFKLLKKEIKIVSISDQQIFRLNEIRLTRNALAHSSGIANARYQKNANKSHGRVNLGEQLRCDRAYVYESAGFMKDIVNNLTQTAISSGF